MFDYKKLFTDEEEKPKKKPVVEEEVEEVVEEPEEEVVEEEVETPKVEIDVNKIAELMSDKIVKAIQTQKNLNDRDTRILKEKFFEPKNGMRGIEYPDRLDNLSTQDKILLFWKSLLMKDRDQDANRVFKALIEGTDTQGGYLVPEEWKTAVFRCIRDLAVMRKLARIIPMQTDTMHLNTLTARPAAYWTAEYASKSTTSAEFGQVDLSPNDLVCLIPVTHQLIADANIDIIRFITELFAEAIAAAEDKAFFVGTGTGQPQGLTSCTGILTHAAGGLLNFDDMITAYYKIPQAHRNSPNAAWVASRKVIEILHKVKDTTTGRYVWLPAGMDDVTRRPVDMVLGHPIYEQNDIPEDQLYFGDFKYYAIGDRQSLAVETTREGGDAWRRNATEIKAVERVDGKCILGCAFVKVTGIQS